MFFEFLIYYILIPGMIGIAAYELFLWRRRKKHLHFLKLLESGALTEIPKVHQEAPVRVKGILYLILVISVGWMIGLILSVVAFGLVLGACFLGMPGFG